MYGLDTGSHGRHYRKHSIIGNHTQWSSLGGNSGSGRSSCKNFDESRLPRYQRSVGPRNVLVIPQPQRKHGLRPELGKTRVQFFRGKIEFCV